MNITGKMMLKVYRLHLQIRILQIKSQNPESHL